MYGTRRMRWRANSRQMTRPSRRRSGYDDERAPPACAPHVPPLPPPARQPPPRAACTSGGPRRMREGGTSGEGAQPVEDRIGALRAVDRSAARRAEMLDDTRWLLSAAPLCSLSRARIGRALPPKMVLRRRAGAGYLPPHARARCRDSGACSRRTCRQHAPGPRLARRGQRCVHHPQHAGRFGLG